MAENVWFNEFVSCSVSLWVETCKETDSDYFTKHFMFTNLDNILRNRGLYCINYMCNVTSFSKSQIGPIKF